MTTIPDGWTLAASTFNWTPDVIRADADALTILASIAASGVADVVELEAGQIWRSFPDLDDAEVRATSAALAGAGGRVSVVGASIDDFAPDGRPRTEEERFQFLLPQLRAAALLGAEGVRLPIGQAGPALLHRLLPLLDELDLILYEEIQGQQTPQHPQTASAIEAIADLADPRVRLVCDISMLMPSLPPTYLERLRRGGVPAGLVGRLAHGWREPDTMHAVRAALGAGAVPPQVHTLFMNLLVRFGQADADDLRDIVDLIGGFHLKFWDLDDEDGRVSEPIRDVARLMTATDFRGTFTSEWGGHEWLHKESATEMTRRHLALARAAFGSVLSPR